MTYEASSLATVLGFRAGAIPGGGRLLLLDSQGRTYQTETEGAAATTGFDLAGLQRVAGSDGPSLHRAGDELIALAPLGEQGEAGAVALVIRRSALYHNAWTSLAVSALILLVGFGLLLLLLRWITVRLIVAPAVALMQMADALGRGDLEARASVLPGRDEFSRVARAFDRMAAEVQQRTVEGVHHLSQMERLNRLHEVLALVNEAILRRASALRLMQDLCDITCTTGGFSHVWIAEVDASSDRLNVVSWAAAMPTRVWVDFSVSLDSSDPQSQGYVAEAIHTGKPAGSNHFRTDPRTRPWHERARELDIASSLAVPLGFAAHGRRRVLALHASEENYFAAREIQLIEQVAQDAVFGFSLIDTESKLAHSTTHDLVTGLPTAQLLMHRMRELMQEARADRKQLIISVIDVGIQQISNQLGLRQGNLLLTEMGQELEARLGRGDTVGISPDSRFSLVLSDLGHLDEVASRLAAEVAVLQEISAGTAAGTLHQKVSVGVAVFPDDGDDADELFDKALAALDLAGMEDGGVRFFSAQTNCVLQENRQLLKLLHGALARSEMSLPYQPIVSLKMGALHGFEALLRWHHAELGQIPPDRFIPLAESSGLIHELGDWVVRQVVAQATAWSLLAGSEIFISLNVSALQLDDIDFAERVGRMLEGYSASQRVRIALEVTESHLIGDIDRSVQLLKRLSGLGLSIILDDFGTGYSSLSYLYRLPLDVLKIDRSFTADVVSKPLVRNIVQGIHALARSLDLETVVEGIEGLEQQQVLEQIGCDYAQGFLYDRALSADEAQRKWMGVLV
ncbi:MAG: EAL domain-containing protein [Rhodanobacter sp.]